MSNEFFDIFLTASRSIGAAIAAVDILQAGAVANIFFTVMMILFRDYLTYKNVLYTSIIFSVTIILVVLMHIEDISVYLDFLSINYAKELAQVPITPSNSLVQEQPSS